MIEKLGIQFSRIYLKYMPNAFVFALLLTLVCGITAYFWTDSGLLYILESWYRGFFDLLSFTMQVVLMIITGYSIAISPLIKRWIDTLSQKITSPTQVYFWVTLIGMLLAMVSFGWVVITCVLARSLALRVKGVNYPFLIACVYFSLNTWVLGFSSSIPLLLNTEKNYLISTGLLANIIGTDHTLASSLNLMMMGCFLIIGPLAVMIFNPGNSKSKDLHRLQTEAAREDEKSIEEEAQDLNLPFDAFSDRSNNSALLQGLVATMGLIYLGYHFYTKGLDLNFNIMIFLFLVVGMLLHRTPSRYIISMKRSSTNISGILFQYPFYAGIMGIMLYTGMGEKMGLIMAELSSIDSYPLYAYLTGAVVNFAIPSAGGEFAVIGPSLISAIQNLGAGLPAEEVTAMISRASMAVAYGESLSNLLQPFFLLIVLPVMAKGMQIQARDVMGYLVLPFTLFFVIQILLVLYWPM